MFLWEKSSIVDMFFISYFMMCPSTIVAYNCKKCQLKYVIYYATIIPLRDF